MPNRWIRESCRTSKNLSVVSDFSERLFWRLITTADDFGRFMACPALVKAACFPLVEQVTIAMITEALDDLARHELIGLYESGDRQFGFFRKWSEHQGEPRAKKSKYPAPLSASVCSCKQMCADAPVVPDSETETNSDSSPLSLPPSLSLVSSKSQEEKSVDDVEWFRDLVTRWNAIPGVKEQGLGPTIGRSDVCRRALAVRKAHIANAWWEALLDRVRRSDFLCGRVSSRGSEFHVSLFWVLGPKNLSKLLNGEYDNFVSKSVPHSGPDYNSVMEY